MQLSPSSQDFGTLNPDELRFSARRMSATTAPLGKRHMRLNIMCDEARVMAVTFRSLASGGNAYQFGNNGGFSLVVVAVQLDGVSVLPGTVSVPGDPTAVSSGNLMLEPGKYVVPVQNQHAASGRALTLEFEIDTWLTTEALKARDDIKLEGRGYFELG